MRRQLDHGIPARGRRRLLTVLSTTLLLVAPSLVAAPPANAGICESLGLGAQCRIDFGNPENSMGIKAGKGDDNGNGPVRPLCNLGPPKFDGVPCLSDAGLWSNDWQCYVVPMAPQPDASDPKWGKDIAKGAHVYDCSGWDGKHVLPSKPRAEAGRPSTLIGNVSLDKKEQLERALGIELNSLFVGMAPKPTAGSKSRGAGMGVVGTQVWMWGNPTPFTPWERETPKDDPSGYWAHARVTHLSWDMGDGTPRKVCTRAQMVEYQPWMKNRTPECGHKYTKPGRYWVNMWTHFRVEWNDVHGLGGEEIILRRSMTVRIGENQVVNQ